MFDKFREHTTVWETLLQPTKFSMQLTRMTKGTVVYENLDAPVKTLYITKVSLDGATAPPIITVSIEPQVA